MDDNSDNKLEYEDKRNLIIIGIVIIIVMAIAGRYQIPTHFTKSYLDYKISQDDVHKVCYRISRFDPRPKEDLLIITMALEYENLDKKIYDETVEMVKKNIDEVIEDFLVDISFDIVEQKDNRIESISDGKKRKLLLETPTNFFRNYDRKEKKDYWE